MVSKDTDQELLILSKSDDIKIMINAKENEVIKELFHSLLSRYETGLETMKGSSLIFDQDDLLYYRYHRRNPEL